MKISINIKIDSDYYIINNYESINLSKINNYYVGNIVFYDINKFKLMKNIEEYFNDLYKQCKNTNIVDMKKLSNFLFDSKNKIIAILNKLDKTNDCNIINDSIFLKNFIQIEIKGVVEDEINACNDDIFACIKIYHSLFNDTKYELEKLFNDETKAINYAKERNKELNKNSNNNDMIQYVMVVSNKKLQ